MPGSVLYSVIIMRWTPTFGSATLNSFTEDIKCLVWIGNYMPVSWFLVVYRIAYGKSTVSKY